MIHIQDEKEPEDMSFHLATQKKKLQFKTYEFIWRFSLLIFLGFSWLWVPETGESKTADKGDINVTSLLKPFLTLSRIVTISSGL